MLALSFVLGIAPVALRSGGTPALHGIRPGELAELQSLHLPIALPVTLPPGFAVAAVLTYDNDGTPAYDVVYSNGPSAFAVLGSSKQLFDTDPRVLRALPTKYRSQLLGAYRVVPSFLTDEGKVADDCVNTDNRRSTNDLNANHYVVITCAGTLAGFLAIANNLRVINLRASRADPLVSTASLPGLSKTARASLHRVDRVPVMVPLYLPSGFQAQDRVVITSIGAEYDIFYSRGVAWIREEIRANVHFVGGGSVHLGDLLVPVHSRLFGDFALADSGDNCLAPVYSDELDELARQSEPSEIRWLPNITVDVVACNVPPYDVKHVIESMQAVRP